MSSALFNWKDLNAAEISRELTEGLRHFTASYSEQFTVRIPSGTLPRIDDLRDNFVPYLKDSQYKSNICYLLHLIHYQLWTYKVFRPQYSLENAFFYQQMVTLGIIAEAIAHAILLNPCIEVDTSDRSRGKVAPQYHTLHEQISRQNFAQNIDILVSLNIISEPIREQYHQIRREMRNLVHIQGWKDRLYQSLTHDYFTHKLKSFVTFSQNLKNNINMNFSAEELQKVLQGNREIYYGRILNYHSQQGYGFISSYDFPENIFFHISEFASNQTPQIDSEVKFNVQNGPRGLMAVAIKKISS